MGDILDGQVAALVARIAARFVHLEGMMGMLLAELSGADPQTAGYMLRAIKSPRGRVDLMRDLLTKSPRNKELGEEWDQALAEFWRINLRRNDLIHGQWFSREDGSTWLAVEDEHGLSFFAARRIEAQELEALLDEIGLCTGLVIKPVIEAAKARRSEHPQPPREPTP